MKIFIKNLQKKLPIREAKIKTLILKILRAEKIKRPGWINICFVDNYRIKKFNRKFLKTNTATDVLAFNLSRKDTFTADIIISAQTAITNARKFKNSSEQELMLYTAHGLLHILGYDDHGHKKTALMRKKEKLYVH